MEWESVRHPAKSWPSVRPRFQLRHLLLGVAVLCLLVGSFLQTFVIQRRSAELARWGESLRKREDFLRQMESRLQREERENERRRGKLGRDEGYSLPRVPASWDRPS
jgi:hypothetical protein